MRDENVRTEMGRDGGVTCMCSASQAATPASVSTPSAVPSFAELAKQAGGGFVAPALRTPASKGENDDEVCSDLV
jgi:hypothetical protein